MATIVLHQPVPQSSPTPPPLMHPLSLHSSRPNSAPIPNKHIPFCPPGPAPGIHHQNPATPPDSPPSKNSNIQRSSLLRSANTYTKAIDNPPVYSIDASDLAAVADELAAQRLPEPEQIFPWCHGLHPENQIQLAFFMARRKTQRSTPKCLRGTTIVKAGGDLTRSKLKGAVSPDEILNISKGRDASFLEVDPRQGFSVRNFQIQATKMAVVSDIVVYGDENLKQEDVYDLAKKFAIAQSTWRVKSGNVDHDDAPVFNTFVVSSPFHEFEAKYPELVAIGSNGKTTGQVVDFFQWERQEMCAMSQASEIATNVWLGPTPDSMLDPEIEENVHPTFDILIEASDLAQPPDAATLRRIGELSYSAPQHLDFPSSGSIMPQTYLKSGSDPLTEMCQWIHNLAASEVTTEPSQDEGHEDSDGDIPMKLLFPKARKILIHCTDGYTESTLLAMAYYMYACQIPLHEAWIRLHCEKNRNFFAYPSDVALLSSVQSRLVPALPLTKRGRSNPTPEEPAWLSRIDGSLPSRILPYMYLGNLNHANNPDLLRALGITRILSVGEPVTWTKSQLEAWGPQNLLFINGVQDNGVDPLMKDFDRCLAFIAKGKTTKTATLVHCRVGVSRSATICIAEVMSSLHLSFPRAYCFVRARRLNVIIQPHLRFAYELLKWDEICQQRRGEEVRRELEWGTVAREIGALNQPYCSR